ncbi:transcriptional regulator [Candidatus Nanosalina sp. VS9-1]|uniref:transcriptional regulator n=1 Tax=Candidatus Nanosalina sp. VS9-1 TaxID=3388566 RepID=UPI0039E07B29
MRFEVEVVSEEVLPAIRSMIAKELKDDYGLIQREIANKLDVTQPAVSNYLNDTRANPEILQKIRDDPQIQLLIDDAAGKAAKNENYSDEISQIIWNIRDKGLIKERFEGTEKII